MKIILNCKKCNSNVYVLNKEGYYMIECCDLNIEEESIKECIDEWNNLNNFYHHLFGVKFKLDYENDKMKKVLDTFYVYDEIIIEEAKMVRTLIDDKLFKISDKEIKKIFSNCSDVFNSINGMELRKGCHMPDYELYKITSDFELEDSDVQMLINSWSTKELNKYKKEVRKNIK